MYKDHFLTPTEGRTYIDSKNTSLDNLMEMLPDSRRNAEDITCLSEAKVIDSSYAFDASNLGSILSYDFCNAPRYMYSQKIVCEPNGPRKLQACVLNKWTDSGHACGN